MVNFGEFLQAEVERPEAKHTRVFFVDYHALKERLYEIDEGGAASFGVRPPERCTAPKLHSSEVIIECLEVDLAGGRAHGARSVTPVHENVALLHSEATHTDG